LDVIAAIYRRRSHYDRQDLEEALGYTLNEIHLYKGEKLKVSFVSHHIWFYFIIDVIVTGLILTIT